MGQKGSTPTGELLRHWRLLRGMSQLDLALRSGTSARNLSFIENGRSMPGEPLLERLCEALAVPSSERYVILRSAGFGRAYAPIDLDEPGLSWLNQSLDMIMRRFDPFPLVVMNRQFEHLKSNASLQRIVAFLVKDPAIFREGAPNMVELVFREDGLRPCLVNWHDVAYRALHRLYRDALMEDPDGRLSEVYERLIAIEGVPEEWRRPAIGDSNPLVRFRVQKEGRKLELDSLILTVGTPTDVTFQEIRMRCFLPADSATRDFLFELAGDADSI